MEYQSMTIEEIKNKKELSLDQLFQELPEDHHIRQQWCALIDHVDGMIWTIIRHAAINTHLKAKFEKGEELTEEDFRDLD
ncbi:hypothetical protein N9955_00460 [bacterium]|nr:hypothetical protein [bacterium]